MNYQTMPMEELRQANKERQEHLDKVTNGFFHEMPTDNPIINELRFEHEYLYLHPFVIHSQLGLKFELSWEESSKRLHLGFISVPDEMKRQGYGTQMMQLLCELADKYGYSIDLDVDPKFGTGKRVLKKFYKSFGFVKGNYGIDHLVRKPKTID